jgi:hypothetical protein
MQFGGNFGLAPQPTVVEVRERHQLCDWVDEAARTIRYKWENTVTAVAMGEAGSGLRCNPARLDRWSRRPQSFRHCSVGRRDVNLLP